MDMTSDPSLQESCMAALHHMGVEVRALIGKTNELESENAKLRKQVLQLRLDWESERDYANQMEAKEKMAVAENAKLRDLVTYMHRCYVMGHDWGFYGAPEKEHVEDTMRELGIEV